MSDDEVTAREMTVVNALKHSILTSTSPGLSVNTHPNAFMLNVIGELDLLKAAKRALVNLDDYDKFMAAKKAKEEAASAPAPVVSDPDGHG